MKLRRVLAVVLAVALVMTGTPMAVATRIQRQPKPGNGQVAHAKHRKAPPAIQQGGAIYLQGS